MSTKTYFTEFISEDIVFGVLSKFLSMKDFYKLIQEVYKDKLLFLNLYNTYLINKLVDNLLYVLRKKTFNILKDFLIKSEAVITGSFITNSLNPDEISSTSVISDIDVFVNEKYIDLIHVVEGRLGHKFTKCEEYTYTRYADEEFIIPVHEYKSRRSFGITSVLDLNLVHRKKFEKVVSSKLRFIIVKTDDKISDYIRLTFDFNFLKNVLYMKDKLWNLDIYSIEDIIYKYIDIDIKTTSYLNMARINKYIKRGYRLNTSTKISCNIIFVKNLMVILQQKKFIY